MKLTEKQKIEIYQKRKQGTPIPCLSLEYGINKLNITDGQAHPLYSLTLHK